MYPFILCAALTCPHENTRAGVTVRKAGMTFACVVSSALRPCRLKTSLDSSLFAMVHNILGLYWFGVCGVVFIIIFCCYLLLLLQPSAGTLGYVI